MTPPAFSMIGISGCPATGIDAADLQGGGAAEGVPERAELVQVQLAGEERVAFLPVLQRIEREALVRDPDREHPRVDRLRAGCVARGEAKAGRIVEAGFPVREHGHGRGVGVLERQYDIAPTGEFLQHGGILHAHPDQAVGKDEDRVGLSVVQDRRAITGRDGDIPHVLEDLAVIVDEDVPAVRVLETILQGGGKLLKEARLFDVFRGGQIGAGKKSLAYSLTYQAADRTLTDKDAAQIRQRIIRRLEQELGARIRS